MILWYEMKLSKHSFRMESFNLPLNYELRVWRQELQSDSPDCWSFKAMHNCQAWSLLAKSKLSQKKKNHHNITQRVWGYFLFVWFILSSHFSLHLSGFASPQTTCKCLSSSHFGSKLTQYNLSLAQGSVFQSISQGRHENPHFFLFSSGFQQTWASLSMFHSLWELQGFAQEPQSQNGGMRVRQEAFVSSVKCGPSVGNFYNIGKGKKKKSWGIFLQLRRKTESKLFI